MSSICIVGTGHMCRALGYGLQKAGHKIYIGSRNPDAVTAAKLGIPEATVSDPVSAIASAEIVVLAIPFLAVRPFVEKHRQQLSGKTIIDISNPFDKLANNERAAAEYTADALGGSHGLVAAFKDNFAATINLPNVADGHKADVKIAGDDEAAKDVVRKLAGDLNHRVLDCGPLHNARFIDAMVSLMLIIDQNYQGFTMKTGWWFFGLDESNLTKK